MKVLPIDSVRFGYNLEQSIYRHDGLLCLPKGVMLRQAELNMLHFYQIRYLSVSDPLVRKMCTEETLDIIEHAYVHSTLWDAEFGKGLFAFVRRMIMKNKKVQSYLNELRGGDSFSFAQCLNISLVVTHLLKERERPNLQLAKIAFLCLIHDVGKIQFSSLFNKERALSESEFEELKQHPYASYDLLKRAKLSDADISFVLHTHERVDGTGYPDRLRGKEIPAMAQLISIADMYNALLSYRPHRGAFAPTEALEMLKEERGRMFDSSYLDLFLARFTPYREGALVELSNGKTGQVKKVPDKARLFPIVEMLSDITGEVEATVDLNRYQDLRIAKILQMY